MNCPQCGAKADKSWTYCPACGSPFRALGASGFDLNFGEVFQELDKMAREMQNALRMRERNVEVLDLTPFFQHLKRGGFSVRITQQGGKPARVDVQTFGSMNPRQVEAEVQKQLGVRPKIAAGASAAKQVQRVETHQRFSQAKQTKEPPADIRRLGDRLVVDISLPGVKEQDVEVNELESSVEVKAIAGDTAYFKILTKPERFSVARKQFRDGKLHLEFA